MAQPGNTPARRTVVPDGYGLHNCPVFVVPINEAQCLEQTRIPRRNAEKCAPCNCGSPQRRCRICVSQGKWREKETIVVDLVTGLCGFHTRQGENAQKREEYRGEVSSLMTTANTDREAEERDVVEAGRLAMIPVNLICPNPNQPRKWFDPEDLELLAASITDIGQLKAIAVRAIKDDPRYKFQLVDGERRWRACKIVKIRAEIQNIEDADHLHEVSSVSNLGAVKFTELEEAHAIQQIMERRNRQPWQVARAFGWKLKQVTDRLELLKLHPKVQELMAPTRNKRDRLKAAVAKYLADLPSELQIELATEIVAEHLRAPQAMHLIRRRANETGAKAGTAKRGRRPHEDMRNFLRYLWSTEDGADRILESPDHLITEMFRHQDPRRLDETVKQLDGIVERLGKIRLVMEQVKARLAS